MIVPAHCADPRDTIREAARRMGDMGVGCLLVIERESLLGIVTDRDILIRAIANGFDPDTTPVREVMSHCLAICYEDEPLTNVSEIFLRNGVQRLPVVDRSYRPVGILPLMCVLGHLPPESCVPLSLALGEKELPSARG